MKVISELSELDEKLEECAAACAVSDDALRHVFSTFRMDISSEVPADPFSEEYRDFQMDLYAKLSGKSYDPVNEVSKFDVVAADRRPFPYYTNSSKTTGFFTMGVGFLLHSLNLPAGSRVLEFGAGWGNTTLAMAMSGFKVTAVDIEKDFCDLIALRAKRQEVDIEIVNADFMWAEAVTEPYDAVVFFECFHHCADHLRLLRALHTAVRPGGLVYFAAEPIVADFPIPWGPQGDGESLWAIRQNGWMELGFNETYFREAMTRTGWTVRKLVFPDIGWAAVWEAKRIEDGPFVSASNKDEATVKPTQKSPELADVRRIEELESELASIRQSTSWRLTKPLRAIKGLLQR